VTLGTPQTTDRARGGYRTLRPRDGRRSNLSLVLQTLYHDPQLTRADLARRTGLTKVTISDLVADLIEQDLVGETGLTAGVRPGKPAATLAVREDAWDVIALDLSGSGALRGATYSLTGTRRAEASVDLAGRQGEAASTAVVDLARQCVGLATRRVLGIGVGTPGAVDARGTVVAAPNLGWRNWPLQDILGREFALPVAVQNDANAAVVAEHAFGAAGDNVVRVQISGGVGAGVLVSGALHLGDAGAAGEIGHLVIEFGGATCSCGKRGCLETWISVPALTQRLAHGGDRDATLAEAGRRLGMALAPLVAGLDLTHVVLGGPPDLIAGPFRTACEDLIAERTHSEFRGEAAVTQSDLGDEAVLLGAVALVLRTTLGVS